LACWQKVAKKFFLSFNKATMVL